MFNDYLLMKLSKDRVEGLLAESREARRARAVRRRVSDQGANDMRAAGRGCTGAATGATQ